MKNVRPGDYFTIPLFVLHILIALSFIDWASLSDNRLTSFSLVEDLFPKTEVAVSKIEVDPELFEALEEVTSDVEVPLQQLDENSAVDDAQPIQPSAPAAPEWIDGVLPIEDYSPDGDGAAQLRAALERTDRPARIAVIGDSYIEGDIFTQDLRSLLQERYGGRGVGYMAMHSDFPGFRRSVFQSDNGWTVADIRKLSGGDPLRIIPGEYCIGDYGATASFRGSKLAYADSWSVARLLCVAPLGGSVTMRGDGVAKTFDLAPSADISCLTLEGETSTISVTSGADSLSVLGLWLDDPTGVSVDCMSLRGNSGATHRSLSVDVARRMAEHIDYDMIIVEYGMNALSSEQTEYSSYSLLMRRVVERLRQCYPDASILMFGVGDRGQKSGTDVVSLPTVEAMIKAQRDCAAASGVMFWDVREAMGGAGSVVDWRDRGLVNADYIHLSHKGGAELASIFVKSLFMKLDENR